MLYICTIIINQLKHHIMKTTMKSAIKTYAKLTNNSFEYVVNECLNENKIVIENVTKLMFAVA
jgi:hypothetical protein